MLQAGLTHTVEYTETPTSQTRATEYAKNYFML